MIRLIATDLDGTLLSDPNTIHPDKVAALREAVEAGVHLVAASGRRSESSSLLMLDAGFQTAHIIGAEGSELRVQGTSPNDGAMKAFQKLSPRMAGSLLHTVAYALVSGASGSIPGRSFKVTVSDLSFAEARSLRDSLGEVRGVNGVYQRAYANRTLELDVSAETSSEEIAIALEALGVEITGITAGTVNGRKGR